MKLTENRSALVSIYLSGKQLSDKNSTALYAAKELRYYARLSVYDNHYAMSVRPIAVYEEWNPEEEDIEKTYSTLTEYPIPIYQENRGEATKVTLEITDYLDIITTVSSVLLIRSGLEENLEKKKKINLNINYYEGEN